jgi:single-strand DNA-binding protein
MSASVNKAFAIGNLTRDPELKFIASGSAVCEFAIALNRSYKGKDGKTAEEVTFVDVVAWGKLGEIVAEHCKKGKQVHIEGYLKQDRWDSPEGKKMSRIRIVAERVVFLGSKEPLVVADESQPVEGEVKF